MLRDDIRRQARQGPVRIDINDVAPFGDSFLMQVTNRAPEWMQDECAADGIKLICDQGVWYAAPLDD